MAESSDEPDGHGRNPATSLLKTAGNPSPHDVSLFTHTPCYCEENVYLLCKKLSALGLAEPMGRDLFVVFISNEKKQVPLWCQKASKRMDGLVLWDYHVICIQTQRNGKTSTHDLVWDLDSTLPFPSPLNRFASDRSHMKDPDGNWYSLPPKYEPIVAEDGAVNNFDKYLGMTAGDITTDMEALIDGVYSNKFGVLMNEPTLESFFAQIHLLPRVT